MITVTLSQYRVNDTERKASCQAVVSNDGQEVYQSQVIMGLLAIRNRLTKYGLTEPADAIKAIMREHCEMWFGLDIQNWKGSLEMETVRDVLRQGTERGGLRSDIEVILS